MPEQTQRVMWGVFRSDLPLPSDSFPLAVPVPVSQPLGGYIAASPEVGVSTSLILSDGSAKSRPRRAGLAPILLVIINYAEGDMVELKSINLSFAIEQIYRGLRLTAEIDL